jgi:hypothetical protein
MKLGELTCVALLLTVSFSGMIQFGSQNASAGADGTEVGNAICYYPNSPTWDWVFIAGTTSSYGMGGNDFLLMRYNKDGAQSLFRTWGTIRNDIATCMCCDSNDIYVGGYSTSKNNDYDAQMVSFKPVDGSVKWITSLIDGGYSTDDIITGITEGKDPTYPYNIYLTGYTISPLSDTDIILQCYDQLTGNFLWQIIPWDRGFHFNDKAMSIVAIDNYLYVVGSTTGQDGNVDWLLLKFSAADGTLQKNFPVTWGGQGVDVANNVVIDYYDPGYTDYILIGGVFHNNNNGGDYIAINKYSLDGTRITNPPWPIIYGTPEKHYITKAIETDCMGQPNPADVYAVGMTDEGPIEGNVAFIYKFDKISGALTDSRYWYYAGDECANAIATDSLSFPDIYVAGHTTSSSWDELREDDSLVLNYDYYSPPGSGPHWCDIFGESLTDEPKATTVDGQGNIYVTGSTNSFSNYEYNVFNPQNNIDKNIFVIKYNNQGTLIWRTTYDMDNDNDCGNAITISGNTVYVAGYGTEKATGIKKIGIVEFNIVTGIHGPARFETLSNCEECARGIVVYGDDVIYITGYRLSQNQKDVILAQYPVTLSQQNWIITWGSAAVIDDGYALAIGNDGISDYIYVVGETMTWGSGQLDGFLEKFDLNGNCMWNPPKCIGGPNNDGARGITIVGGAIYQVGYFYFSGWTHSFVYKYNMNGVPLYSGPIYWGYGYETIGYSVAILNQFVYIAGHVHNYINDKWYHGWFVQYWDESKNPPEHSGGKNPLWEIDEPEVTAYSIVSTGAKIYFCVQAYNLFMDQTYDSLTIEYDNWEKCWG